MERWRRLPAGFQLTCARHPVTLASEDHVPQDSSSTGLVVVPIDLRLNVGALLTRVQEDL